MAENKRAGSQEAKLDDLYQEVILDHNRRPRNFGKIENPSGYAHGINPLCGDDYHVYIKKNDQGVVEAVFFEGQGCAISKASASLMTTAVTGKSSAEARRLKDAFIELLTQEVVTDQARQTVGKLRFLETVKQFPVRVKCATLAWRALEEALKDKKGEGPEVTTEDGF